MTPEAARVLVIGLGNDQRGDDRAGLVVARRLHRAASEAGIDLREHQGEPTELLDDWRGREAVVLVDAMCSGMEAGTIRRFDATDRPLPLHSGRPASTHALGLEAAIELGRALQRLPARAIVYAVEGRAFEPGSLLSEEVDAAIPALAEAVFREARRLGASPTAPPHRAKTV